MYTYRVKHNTVNIACFFILIVLAIALRWVDLTVPNQGAKGIEATYHAMLTGQALEKNSFEYHYGLPTVTLNPSKETEPESWGSTHKSVGGSMIYTSFPPLGFYPVAFLYSIFETIQTTHIGILGTIFAIISSLLAGTLSQNVFQTLHPTATIKNRNSYFWLGAIGYILVPEVTISQGVVYWPHTISQSTILISFIAFLKYLQVTTKKEKILWFFIIGAATVISCLLEWTGYLLVLGLCTSFLILAVCDVQKRIDSIKKLIFIALLGLSSALLTLNHFCLGISCSSFIKTSMMRANRRSLNEVENYSWIYIIESYWNSMGLMILIVFSIPFIFYKAKKLPQQFYLILIPSVFITLENVILLQHALEYPFDRMKIVIPIGLLTIALLYIYPIWKYFILSSFLTMFVANLFITDWQRQDYDAWETIANSNMKMVENLKADKRFTCAALSSPEQVRGYLNITFERDIFEHTKNLHGIFQKRPDICAILQIETEHLYPDLPKITNTVWIEKNSLN